jgi:hypothetical protein
LTYVTTSTARETNRKDGKHIAVTVKAAEVFKKGDIVKTKAADGLGYKAFANAAAATGDIFCGVALENKTAAAGDADIVRVDTCGVHEFDIATTTLAAALGRPVYHEDGASGTPTTVVIAAPTHGCRVGVVVGLVSVTKVRVKLEGFVTPAT